MTFQTICRRLRDTGNNLDTTGNIKYLPIVSVHGGSHPSRLSRNLGPWTSKLQHLPLDRQRDRLWQCLGVMLAFFVIRIVFDKIWCWHRGTLVGRSASLEVYSGRPPTRSSADGEAGLILARVRLVLRCYLRHHIEPFRHMEMLRFLNNSTYA